MGLTVSPSAALLDWVLSGLGLRESTRLIMSTKPTTGAKSIITDKRMSVTLSIMMFFRQKWVRSMDWNTVFVSLAPSLPLRVFLSLWCVLSRDYTQLKLSKAMTIVLGLLVTALVSTFSCTRKINLRTVDKSELLIKLLSECNQRHRKPQCWCGQDTHTLAPSWCYHIMWNCFTWYTMIIKKKKKKKNEGHICKSHRCS